MRLDLRSERMGYIILLVWNCEQSPLLTGDGLKVKSDQEVARAERAK